MLLCLLWSLMEVFSQTEYPYVSFMGKTLPNHSYVDLSQVGNDNSGSDSVQCHTDLSTCCSGAQSEHRGDWFAPAVNSKERLPSSNDSSADIYQVHGTQRVDLRRRNDAVTPSGIYRCDIAVHNDSDTPVRKVIYVGLYIREGMAIE